MVFTCFPITWYGIYDKEYSYEKVLEKENKYYIQGMNNKLFHTGRFWKWILYGSFQSVMMFVFSFYANSSATNKEGYLLDLIGQGIFHLKKRINRLFIRCNNCKCKNLYLHKYSYSIQFNSLLSEYTKLLFHPDIYVQIYPFRKLQQFLHALHIS